MQPPMHVESPGVGDCVGHVHYFLVVSVNFIRVGAKANTFFSGIWAYGFAANEALVSLGLYKPEEIHDNYCIKSGIR